MKHTPQPPEGAGRVYLVGAGPGDPELLTLKAVRVLGMADAVLYDRLIDVRVLDHVPPHALRIDVGKRSGRHTMPQHEINARLIELARQGLVVVRLKGGDPFVFGRGGEEMAAVQEAGFPCEVIPGISSAIAAPAAAGIPVTHRGYASHVTIVTGHAAPEEQAVDWSTLSALEGTLVILMGRGTLRQIVSELIRYGKHPQTPAAIVEQAWTPHERSVTGRLEHLADRADAAGIGSPAVVVVGAVVSLNDVLTQPRYGVGHESHSACHLDLLDRAEGRP